MLPAVDLKVGTTFIYNGEPHKVLEYRHTHMGRGSADVRLKVQGLLSGSIKPVVLTPSKKFEEAALTKVTRQFLYREGGTSYFMDPVSFEQIGLEKNVVGEVVDFLKEGEHYDIYYWDETPLEVLVAPKVDLTVIECDPGVKGNSASNMYKSAIVEGNIKVKVPLFVNKGDRIRIDTVNRKYVEKAK